MAIRNRVDFTLFLRGTEVRVRGYFEPADYEVGLMQESLAIESLLPVEPVEPFASRLWREPDIDDLLATGEFDAIEQAAFDARNGPPLLYTYYQEDGLMRTIDDDF
jgi:hypothetical protein